jgi:AcrR family transcriptional regulator
VLLRATPSDAYAAARRHFLDGDRLDLVALSSELGVARMTLYRWTGSREQLLIDVITAELQELFELCVRAARGKGAARLERIVGNFIESVATAPSTRGFLANEGAAGVQLLTAPSGPLRPRIVANVHGLILEQVDAGAYRPPADPGILADGIVSLGERYLHNGGDPSLNPDPASARVIVRLMLREDAATSR